MSLTRTDSQSDGAGESEKEEIQDSLEPLPEFTGPVNFQRQLAHSHILPHSFLIGALSDSLSSQPDERELVFLVSEFWSRFRSGKSLTSLLASYPHPLFLEELDEYASIAEEIKAVETGRPKLEGSSGRMGSLVCSQSGCLSGTLYFIREEGQWFIEDWEIPFRDWPGKEIGREEDRIAPPVSW